MNTRRPAAGAGAGVRTVQKGQAYAHLASPRQAQTRGNLTSPRQAQKYAHLASPRQAETSTTRTTRRVVAGQNGQPMEVLGKSSTTSGRLISRHSLTEMPRNRTTDHQKKPYGPASSPEATKPPPKNPPNPANTNSGNAPATKIPTPTPPKQAPTAPGSTCATTASASPSYPDRHSSTYTWPVWHR